MCEDAHLCNESICIYAQELTQARTASAIGRLRLRDVRERGSKGEGKSDRVGAATRAGETLTEAAGESERGVGRTAKERAGEGG